jgi:hypothetical protein
MFFHKKQKNRISSDQNFAPSRSMWSSGLYKILMILMLPYILLAKLSFLSNGERFLLDFFEILLYSIR